ncbi:MAG: hypothetical protein GY722_29160, partial [bacterium]|nr:hypothetical protein [bacterium]
MSSLQKQTVATWTEALERMEAQVPEVKRPDSEAACVRVSEFAKSARD